MAIDQLYGDQGGTAIEAPDGNGIVVTQIGNKDQAAEIKKFVEEYVAKAAQRKEVDERNQLKNEADKQRRADESKKKGSGDGSVIFNSKTNRPCQYWRGRFAWCMD